MLVPLGPVAVWAASNFPFAFSVLGGDTASALAAGNAVVVKAHEGHPRLSERVAHIGAHALHAAGAPSASVQLVQSRAAGVALVSHPDIAAGGFTGSIAGGRALFDLAAARPTPIPFYGELGSVNPVVITAGAVAARGDELAAGLAGSFTMGVGQFCTKPGVVLVPAGAGFAAALAAATTAGPATMLNDRIRSSYAEYAAELSGRPGVDVVCGGLPESTGGVGPLVLRTTAAAAIADPEALLTEVFGPTTLLIEYTDEDERRAVLAAVPGSLTGTLHAEPGEDVRGRACHALGARRPCSLRRMADRCGRQLGAAPRWALPRDDLAVHVRRGVGHPPIPAAVDLSVRTDGAAARRPARRQSARHPPSRRRRAQPFVALSARSK